jgi:hypothetical protein
MRIISFIRRKTTIQFPNILTDFNSRIMKNKTALIGNLQIGEVFQRRNNCNFFEIVSKNDETKKVTYAEVFYLDDEELFTAPDLLRVRVF